MTTTFRLVTELQSIIRRDFPLHDRTLLDPNDDNPLVMGEFLMLNGDYELIRGDNSEPAYAMYVEQSRSDTQAIGKVTVLFARGYEADTLIFDTATAPTLGAALKVATVTYGGLSRSGLDTHDTGPVIGYVTRAHASNGNYLRFQQTLV